MRIMETTELHAQQRTTIGKQVRQLRRKGLVPGVLYGHGTKPIVLQIEERDIRQIADQSALNRLITLRMRDAQATHSVLVKEIQRDSITSATLHVDFQEVVMSEKVTAEVSIVLVGEAPAAAEGSVLVQRVSLVQIECLPADLISTIEVDLGSLRSAGDEVCVSDLVIGSSIEILNDPDEVVVQALHSTLEAEAEAEEIEELAAAEEPTAQEDLAEASSELSDAE